MLYDAKRWEKSHPIVNALKIGRDSVAKGWCQRFADDGGGVCAYWAIAQQFESRADAQPAASYLRRVIGPDIIDWNDQPDRTQADVVAAYDSAIALAVSELVFA
jgi:hypothetical protein